MMLWLAQRVFVQLNTWVRMSKHQSISPNPIREPSEQRRVQRLVAQGKLSAGEARSDLIHTDFT